MTISPRNDHILEMSEFSNVPQSTQQPEYQPIVASTQWTGFYFRLQLPQGPRLSSMGYTLTCGLQSCPACLVRPRQRTHKTMCPACSGTARLSGLKSHLFFILSPVFTKLRKLPPFALHRSICPRFPSPLCAFAAPGSLPPTRST